MCSGTPSTDPPHPRLDDLLSAGVETISVPEAARYLGISRNAGYEAAHRGELPVLRIGRTVRVRVRALLKLLVDGEAGSA